MDTQSQGRKAPSGSEPSSSTSGHANCGRERHAYGCRSSRSKSCACCCARPGDVVTREELRRQLWPDGTYVDFEHSLNAAVKRLRAALGDDADNPRFVETLPRRGYRFVAASAAPRRQPAAAAARRRASGSPCSPSATWETSATSISATACTRS